jgi:hypothetical protein
MLRKVPEEVKVRKLSQETYDAIRLRAKRNGRSMGAEMATILTDAVEVDAAAANPNVFDQVEMDSIWVVAPGRMYAFLRGEFIYRLSIMQKVDRGDSLWGFQIEVLRRQNVSVADVNKSSTILAEFELAVVGATNPLMALEAGIDWIRRKTSLSSSNRRRSVGKP